METINKLEKDFKFAENDFGKFGICNSAVLKIFQDIAIDHANLLGVGYDALKQKNLLWVALKIKFEIVRQPQPNESLKIVTYPSGKNMLEFYRNYLIYDSNGDVIIKGASKWCLISSITRRIARMAEVDVSVYEFTEPLFDGKLERLRVFEPECLADYYYQILPEDIDGNNHTNNTVYAKVVDEMLKNTGKQVRTFEIDFLKETLLGERLDMFKVQNESGIIILGKICEALPSFVANVQFAE